MCLVVFAWQTHPAYRLILAANRDEFHQRPSRALNWWPDRPEVLAGRDLQAGGTWLAVSRDGRFATVTNYREQQRRQPGLVSRGALVTDFVTGSESAETFVGAVDGDRYAGFSLLAADARDLYYVSNRGDVPTKIAPGIYGLSNASLDTPWEKVVRSKAALQSLLESDNVNETSLFRLLGDRTVTAASDIDSGHIPFDLARALTAPFIVSKDYGTRCTTILTWTHSGEISLGEQRFDAAGVKAGESRFRIP